jgi:hypothetical protein
MSVKSSFGITGNDSVGLSFISETFLGCSILTSFSMVLTISASSPSFYAEEVSNCCADCLSSVWIIFFGN